MSRREVSQRQPCNQRARKPIALQFASGIPPRNTITGRQGKGHSNDLRLRCSRDAPEPSSASDWFRPQDQNRSFRGVEKVSDSDRLTANKFLRNCCRVVASPKPNHLGWRPQRDRQFIKIRVSCDNCEAAGLRKFPNRCVRRVEQSVSTYMGESGKKVSNTRDEAAREIFVEEQLHRATRRPTRDAYSKTARKSAASSSG